MIVIVTICTFWQNDIIYWYTHTFNEKKYQGASSNEYFLEDNFSYVNNYTDNNVSNKKQLVDLIYYFINSGADKIEAYCTNEYSDCIKDLETISTDQESLSIFNNFVHPYNSFSKLSFSYDEYGNFTITNNKIYDEKMIVEIEEGKEKEVEKEIKKVVKKIEPDTTLREA